METTTSWRPKNHTSTLGLQKMAAWITLDVLNILVSAPLVCENGCLLYLPSPSPVWRFPLMLISYHPKTKNKTRLRVILVSYYWAQLAHVVSCDWWRHPSTNYNLPHVQVVINGMAQEFFLG